MAATYPGTLPSYTGQVGGAGDPLDTPDHATHHQNVADDVVAIATELGTDASGHGATVRDAIATHASRHEVGGADLVKRTLLNRLVAGADTIVRLSCSLVGCTAANITITLETAMLADGAWVDIVDESGTAGTNAITVATEGAETIDGAATASIATNYGSVRVYSNGTNWFTR